MNLASRVRSLECSVMALAAVAAFGAWVGASGCGSPRAPLRPRPSLISKGSVSPVYQSPATWRYHPVRQATLLSRVKLGDGGVLLAGRRGERWLVEEKKGRKVARAAALLAPETLIAILRVREGGWLFVGESGTGYEAREPLGPFARSSAPLDPLIRVSAAGSAMAAVRADGALVRSQDAGVGWQRVGPENERFVDVALNEGGAGLALSVPERVWHTSDAGATWKPLDVDTVGGTRFARDRREGLVMEGVADLYGVAVDPPGLHPLRRNLIRERHELGAVPPRGPRVSAIEERRAVFVANRYLELERDPKRIQKWRLWRGKLGEALRFKPVPKLEGCRVTKLAAFDRWMTVACAKLSRPSSTQRFHFYRSEDRGKTFEQEDFSVEAKADELVLAVGGQGALLVTGACPPHGAGRGCRASGVLFRREVPIDAGAPGTADDEGDDSDEDDVDDHRAPGGKDRKGGPEHELALAATPALAGCADTVVFSTDGSIAYAVGRRTKNGIHAVFVSRDGGKSFEAEEIEQLQGQWSEPDDETRWDRRDDRSGPQLRSAVPAEDGSLALVIESQRRQLLVVTDERGRALSVTTGPGERARLGAVGTRALAVNPRTGQAWESLDGGASWDTVGRLPQGACEGGSDCDLQVFCHLGGCVLGDQLSRIGWNGQAEDDQGLLPPPSRHAPDLYDPALRVPISCNLEEAEWKPLDGVQSAPSADQAAIGRAAWYLPTVNDDDASAGVIHAIGGQKPRLDRVSLLPPVKRAEEHAYVASNQIEGAVAMRYALPRPDARGTDLTNIEVAWDNLLEDRVGRARISNAGAYRPGDSASSNGRAHRANPDLLSIGAGGVFVRVHRYQRNGQETLFVDGRSVRRAPGLTWPTVELTNPHREMANIDGTFVPLMLLDNGTAHLRARRSDQGWVFDAFATGLRDPTSFGLIQSGSIAYVAGRAGRHVMLYDVTGEYHRSLIFPFRATGPVTDPPVKVPMQIDTGDQPRSCSPAQRSDTPRVVVPFQPGTRHPIVVLDVEEPMRVMLTGQSVMHGTPDSPCTAAFEAQIVPVDGGPETQGEVAILSLPELDRSWLFRRMGDDDGYPGRIEYRPMSCRFDPSLRVPAAVYKLPGTRVRRKY